MRGRQSFPGVHRCTVLSRLGGAVRMNFDCCGKFWCAPARTAWTIDNLVESGWDVYASARDRECFIPAFDDGRCRCDMCGNANRTLHP